MGKAITLKLGAKALRVLESYLPYTTNVFADLRVTHATARRMIREVMIGCLMAEENIDHVDGTSLDSKLSKLINFLLIF